MKTKHTYTLRGLSIKQLRDSGVPFYTTWHKGEDFENEKGYKGKVQIDTRKLFAKGSFNKTWNEANKEYKLQNVATICELAWLHFKKTGKRLFGKDYKYKSGYDWAYTWTSSKTSEGGLVYVGRFGEKGFYVHDYWPDDQDLGLGVCLSVVSPLGTGKLGNLEKKPAKPKKTLTLYVLSSNPFDTIAQAEKRVEGWYNSGNLKSGTKLYKVSEEYKLEIKTKAKFVSEEEEYKKINKMVDKASKEVERFVKDDL